MIWDVSGMFLSLITKFHMVLQVGKRCLTIVQAIRINTDYMLAKLTLPSPTSKPDSELISLLELHASESEEIV